jgi:dihydrofolate synthase/folylpolyglutamate synthase
VAIADEELAEQIAAIADLEGLTGVRPTYFEACTAAAFRWFADIAVDVAVVEVGLLGRWDATNVVTAQVAVVTNIGMDHNEFAGPTLADVAREKAGIIEATGVAVIGETDPAIVGVLTEAPAASRLLRGTDFETAGNMLAVGGRVVDIRTPTTIYSDVFVPLHGAHQGDNASLALTAVEAFFAAPLSEEVVLEGFSTVTMPGRFEVLGYQPLVVVDGAHNPTGADTCAQVFFDDFNPDGRRILVVGTLREPTAMLEALRADEFDLVVACTAPSPRGIPVADVARAAVALGCDEVLAADSVEAACVLAMHGADGDDAILAAGSLYVAGAARPALKQLLP